jgi:hypothetical protein
MTGPIVAERVMKARRDGTCPTCRCLIRTGDQIALYGGRWEHVEHVIERQHQAGAATGPTAEGKDDHE